MIKKGLKVRVLTGKDKKKEGEVIEIDRPNNRAKVKKINIAPKSGKKVSADKIGKFIKLILDKLKRQKNQATLQKHIDK